MRKIIVDGDGAVFGRIASFVAKELMKGNYVDLINCEKIMITGRKEFFVAKIQRKRKMGSGASLKGPKYSRREDMLVKRMIRGMLPRDRTKGQEAYKRLKCHIGNGSFKSDELKNVLSFEMKKSARYATMDEIVGGLK